MKVILRGYGIRMNSEQRQIAKAQARDSILTRGTDKTPQPPRDLIVQAGPRGFLVSWVLPSGFVADIQRWRVYKGDENTLYSEINDRGTRQCFIEATAGATPPQTNVFVSSINSFGAESQKVQIQGSATVEAAAPAMPTAPPTFTGPDVSTDYGRGGKGQFALQ